MWQGTEVGGVIKEVSWHIIKEKSNITNWN